MDTFTFCMANICLTWNAYIGAKLAERSDCKFRDNSILRLKQLLGLIHLQLLYFVLLVLLYIMLCLHEDFGVLILSYHHPRILRY